MKKTAVLLCMALLVVVAVSSCAKNVVQSKEPSRPGVANPASEYCVQQGGQLEIRENEEGQYGVCKLPSGKECEEWAFYRKECS